MSVEQPDVVDGLGIDKAGGFVVLTISDHLAWDERHLLALEAKLAAYINFVESGQLEETLPNASGREVQIHLLCQHRPDQNAEAFLEAARSAVSNRGLTLVHGPLPSNGYIDDHG